jgi:hypothetical protein
MYLDRQTPPKNRNQSRFRRMGVVNHVSGLKRKGCPGTLNSQQHVRSPVGTMQRNFTLRFGVGSLSSGPARRLTVKQSRQANLHAEIRPALSPRTPRPPLLRTGVERIV